jgi:syntaxin 6
MLDDLGDRVDNTGSKLRQAQRKMNDFIRRNEGQSSARRFDSCARDEEGENR